MRRFVLYSPEQGVYLGNAMGLGFWSKWDPVGQTHACTFASEADAIAHARTWPPPLNGDIGVLAHEVQCAGPIETGGACFASVAEVQAAGLPGWDPAARPGAL